jgi:hypothetical protein
MAIIACADHGFVSSLVSHSGSSPRGSVLLIFLFDISAPVDIEKSHVAVYHSLDEIASVW